MMQAFLTFGTPIQDLQKQEGQTTLSSHDGLQGSGVGLITMSCASNTASPKLKSKGLFRPQDTLPKKL
jgi:hypothetical protein